MRMGLGLGLTNQSGKGRSSSPEDTIKTAIKERHHIRAIRGGVGVLVQPYALINAQGTRVLRGIIVFIDGEAAGDWTPIDIDVSGLSSVEVYDETFIPSDAFDPSGLAGVIAVIEPLNPFQDGSEGASGEE